MSRKTVLLSAAGVAAMLVAGGVLAGPKPVARVLSAHQIAKSDPLYADAVRSHTGTFVGVMADPRGRSFLNQRGVLH